MKLIHCIDNLDNFNTELYNNLSLGIEIDFSNANLLDGNWLSVVKEYKEKLKSYIQIIGIHGVAFDLNPGSLDKKVVELTKSRYKQNIEIAKLLGASYVVFHSQINPWIRDKNIQERKADRQIEFWNELVELSGENNIKLLIENVYENNFIYLQYLIEKINSPLVRICLDTGHVMASSNVSLFHWIENLKPYIESIHLHWNDGSDDTHQQPDDSALLTFKGILEKHTLEAYIALEYKIDDIEKEVKRVRGHLSV